MMEVETLHPIKKSRAIKERLIQALEAKKRAKWLKMVQALPEMRSEKIERAAHPGLSLEEQLIAAAHAIIESGF